MSQSIVNIHRKTNSFCFLFIQFIPSTGRKQFTIGMIPLKTNSDVLTWYCVHRPAETASKWNRLAYTLFACFAFAINVSSAAADAIYFGRFALIDLEDSLMALMQLFGNASMAYVIAMMFGLKYKIQKIFDNLTSIYETCIIYIVYGERTLCKNCKLNF